MIIRLDMSLHEIVQQYPGTLQVFIANGFEKFSDDQVFRQIGPFLKLKTALKMRQINPEPFIQLLKKAIEAARDDQDFTVGYQREGLNFLGLMPCPLKVPLQEACKIFLQSLRQRKDISLHYLIEGNANNQLSFYDYARHFDHIDELPDILLTPGVNSFFYRDFVEKFVKRGVFINVARYSPNKSFAGIQFQDPDDHYTMFAVNVMVMVVDHTRIGNLPFPVKWGDLLHPEYEKKVAIRGQGRFFCETLLAAIYKEFGLPGIKKLGRSVRYGWHPAQMVKQAGTGIPGAPAISVMPYFFARTIKRKDAVSIVWPEDGAIISPIFMLVKESKLDRVKEIAAFLSGSGVGNIFAGAYFPSVHPDVDNKLPQNARLQWIGWDYLKSKDIEAVIEGSNQHFLSAYKGEVV